MGDILALKDWSQYYKLSKIENKLCWIVVKVVRRESKWVGHILALKVWLQYYKLENKLCWMVATREEFS